MKSQNKHGAKLNIVFIFQEKIPNVVPILSGKLIGKSGEKLLVHTTTWHRFPVILLQIQQSFSQILFSILLYGQKREH